MILSFQYGKKMWRYLLMLLLRLPSYQGKDVESLPFYKLTELTQNPGIYYEYMGETKIERIKWKIAVTLDFSKWEDPIIWREKQMVKFSDACKENLGIEECADLIPTPKFREDLKFLKSLQLDLNVFFLTSTVAQNPRFSPYTHALAKRGAPLEFIGWTSRQLFGTMDAGDRDQLDQDINKLYERTANISALAASQTHIIKSNLEKLHEELAKDKKLLHEHHEQFLKMVNQTKQFKQFEQHSTATETLARWIYQFDRSLEHSISSYKTLVNTIETATQGHLHPLLFTHEQLQDILKTINGHTLPWEHNTVTVDMLHTLSKISVSTSNGKLVVLLEFPLSDKIRYSQYKIHPLPIPKEVVSNSTSYVTLMPQYSHIIASHDMQQYLLATKEYLDTCTKYRNVFMCPPSLPFNLDNEDSPCEFALLARPTQATLRKCKLAISSQSAPYWSKLESTDEWLYSVMTPVQMRIMCNDERKAELTLKGTGIFTLRGQCYGHTNQNILYGVNILQTNQSYLYNPGLTLNLPFMITSKIQSFTTVKEISDLSDSEKQQVQRWAESEDAITLQQLEDKFLEIAAQKREKYQNTTYISSAAISPLILIAIIVIIYKYCCPITNCSICSRRRKASRTTRNRVVDNKDDIYELPTIRPLMSPGTRYAACSVEDLSRKVNRPLSSTSETVIQISPTTIPSCRELAVFQSPAASSSNNVSADQYRMSSVESLNSYVRPLPIQGTSM